MTIWRQIGGLKEKYEVAFWLGTVFIGAVTGAFIAGGIAAKFPDYFTRRLLPSGIIAFFDSPTCPAPWVRAEMLRGRYVVGLDENHKDDVGKAVGTELTNLENRPAGAHQHSYVNTMPVANGGRDRMMGGGNGGFTDPAKPTTSAVDESGQPLKSGTNAPYVQLSACVLP